MIIDARQVAEANNVREDEPMAMRLAISAQRELS
jgi:hypothetical protein